MARSRRIDSNPYRFLGVLESEFDDDRRLLPCPDGHTLAKRLERTGTLLQDLGVAPTAAVVELGFRGVDAACVPVRIIHCGKFKSLDAQQRQWLKRRQAIEPAIDHTRRSVGCRHVQPGFVHLDRRRRGLGRRRRRARRCEIDRRRQPRWQRASQRAVRCDRSQCLGRQQDHNWVLAPGDCTLVFSSVAGCNGWMQGGAPNGLASEWITRQRAWVAFDELDLGVRIVGEQPAISEPQSYVPMALGLAGIAAALRRRRS